MEALSKASGAETAVGEGDKRQAEPGGLELLWEAPPPYFKGGIQREKEGCREGKRGAG